MTQSEVDGLYYLVLAGCIVSGLYLFCLFMEFGFKSKGKR